MKLSHVSEKLVQLSNKMEMFMHGCPAAESTQRNTCEDSQNSNGQDISSHMVSGRGESNPGILQSALAQHHSQACSSVPNSLFLGGPALVESKLYSVHDTTVLQQQLLPDVSDSLGWVTWMENGSESYPTHTLWAWELGIRQQLCTACFPNVFHCKVLFKLIDSTKNSGSVCYGLSLPAVGMMTGESGISIHQLKHSEYSQMILTDVHLEKSMPVAREKVPGNATGRVAMDYLGGATILWFLMQFLN